MKTLFVLGWTVLGASLAMGGLLWSLLIVGHFLLRLDSILVPVDAVACAALVGGAVGAMTGRKLVAHEEGR